MPLHGLGALLYVTALVAFGVGSLTRSKELLAVTAVGGGIGYALRDYFGRGRESVTVMSFYAAAAALWFGLGNLAGYLLADTPFAAEFYKFEAAEFLFEAQVIGTLGTLVPCLAYDAATSHASGRGLLPSLPRVGVALRDREATLWCLVLVAVDWSTRFGGLVVAGLGTLSTLVDIGSSIAVFVLTLLWVDRPSPKPLKDLALPVVIMVVSAGHSFLFDLLRMHMLLPVGAFFLPFVLRKSLDLRMATLALIFAAAFVVAFEPIGLTRRQAYGTGRLSAMASQVREAEAEAEDYGTVPFLARLSTFNQLSQVAAIANEEGFYRGRTLEYLLYVFIPRVIWPEKPIIAPGRWFAEKLGRGHHIEGVGFSNAINMTIAGELYLNFGFTGTATGLAVMAILYALFWETVARLRHAADPVAGGFGLVLLNQALFGGSHFGAVVNIVIWYVAALLFTWGVVLLRGRRQRALRRLAFHSREHPAWDPRQPGPPPGRTS